jgi:hypothetical protein
LLGGAPRASTNRYRKVKKLACDGIALGVIITLGSIYFGLTPGFYAGMAGMAVGTFVGIVAAVKDNSEPSESVDGRRSADLSGLLECFFMCFSGC